MPYVLSAVGTSDHDISYCRPTYLHEGPFGTLLWAVAEQ